MPLQRCTLEGDPGWQFGDAGTCYTYPEGDEEAEKEAKAKAVKQAVAIGGGKLPEEGLTTTEEKMATIEPLYLLADNAAAGKPFTLMLFPIGEWRSAKYPKLSLTRERADAIIANFEADVLGTEVVVDSSGKHDTSAPAAGWIRRVYVAPYEKDDQSGEALYADMEPTELGADLINSGQYKYDSVEIGDVVDNTTGRKTQNVLRSVTLTNTPVLRVLPALLEAEGTIAAGEMAEIALSEVVAADHVGGVDPVERLVGQIDDLLTKLDEVLKGKAGVKTMRTYLRELRVKASQHTTATSEPATESEESAGTTKDSLLSEGVGVPPTERGESMSKLAEYLNLAEGADETAILAEVTKLREDKEQAEAKVKLAEDARIEAKLDEAIKAGHVLPAEKDWFKRLADTNSTLFEEAMTNASKRGLDLSERGEGKVSDEQKRPDVEVSTRAAKLLTEGKAASLIEATDLVFAADPALKDAYVAFSLSGREEVAG